MFRAYIAPYLPLGVLPYLDPGLADLLWLLETEGGIESQVLCCEDLLKLATQLPASVHRGKLLDRVMMPPQFLDRIILTAFHLHELVETFREYRSRWQDWLWERPERLVRLIGNADDLSLILKVFPDQKGCVLDWLFERPEKIIALLRRTYALSELVLSVFPQATLRVEEALLECAAVFGQPSFEDAHRTYLRCWSRWEQKGAARLLEQAARSGTGGILARIPRDLHPTVVSFLGYPGAYAAQAAQENAACKVVQSERRRKPV